MDEYKDFLEPLFIEHFKIFLNQQPSYLLSENTETISIEVLKDFIERKMLKFYRFEFRRNLRKYSNDLIKLNKYQAENMIEEVYEAVLKLNTLKENETQGKYFLSLYIFI